MSAHLITWAAWYRRAAATAATMQRAQTEYRNPSTVLGAECWSLTPSGAAVLRHTAPQRAIPTDKQQGRPCVWCGRPIRPGQPVTILGGHTIHDRPCLGQFDAATDDPTDTGSAD
jgi:hypothetical protein